MGIFSGYLLVSDFDGTLTDSRGKIPERNIEAIRRFVSSGGYFTISTGRTKSGFHNFDEELINAPVILGNGAMAFDYKNNKIAFTNSITEKDMSVLNKMINEFENVGTEFYRTDDKVFVINKNEANIRHFEGLKIQHYTECNEFTKESFPIVKVMVSAGEDARKLQEYFDVSDMGSLKYIPTNGSFVEILSRNAGKGRALHQLADYLGTDKSKTFCAGDGSNDADMLGDEFFSFCPSSGEGFAKNAADKILCSSDEGVIADVIEYIEKNFVRT